MIKLKIDDVEVLREELESIYKEKEREIIFIILAHLLLINKQVNLKVAFVLLTKK